MKKINIFTSAFAAIAIIIIPSITHAQDKCVFTRDLEVGSLGEDVRCLQKYLNSKGFVVSESGVGSLGLETNLFGEKTKTALKKWQTAKGVAAATGNLGPLSRSLYDTELAGITATSITTPSTTTTTTTTSNSAAVVTAPVVTSSGSVSEKKLKELLKSTKNLIEKAKDDISNAKDDGEDVADAEDLIKKAEDKMFDALYEFIDGNFTDSTTLVNKAKKYAENSTSDISTGDEKDADSAIQRAKDALSDARKEIGDADSDKDNVSDAQDIYDDAKEKLNDARSAYDDKDYSEALDLAKKARSLAQDAIDAL